MHLLDFYQFSLDILPLEVGQLALYQYKLTSLTQYPTVKIAQTHFNIVTVIVTELDVRNVTGRSLMYI